MPGKERLGFRVAQLLETCNGYRLAVQLSTIETVCLLSTKRGLAQLDSAENTGRMVGPEANC